MARQTRQTEHRAIPKWVALLVALSLVGAACGSSDEVAAERERVALGVLGHFSAPDTSLERAVLRGIELALQEYNAHPDSTFQAQLVSVDTKGTPEGAAEAARALVEDDLVVGTIGPLQADQALSAGEVLDAAGVAFLIPNVTTMSIPLSGWAAFRRLVANDRAEGEGLARAAASLGERGLVVLAHDGAARSQVVMEGAREILDQSSIPVEEVPGNDSAAAAQTIAAKNAAAVIFAGGPDVAGRLAAAVRGAGSDTVFLATQESGSEAFPAAAGEAAEGAMTNCVCASYSDVQLKEFTDVYRAQYDENPGPFTVEAYEGAFMLLEAIEEVGSRPQDVVPFFQSARAFRGDSKPYRYAQSGELVSPTIWLVRWQNSAPVFFRRSEGPTEAPRD